VKRNKALRWVVGLVAAVSVVALLAYARNGPGVGGREPDPPATTVVVTTTASSPDTSVEAPATTVPDAPAPSSTWADPARSGR
jgi:multidrug efflux pump subunit AcrA (membrane-fusion protein)